MSYFYIIEHTPSRRLYAGARWRKGDKGPATLMTENGYKTSSRTVHRLIEEDGLDSFRVRKVREFETGEQALAYEQRFLERVDAPNSGRWLNISLAGNPGRNLYVVGNENRKQTMLRRYGVNNPALVPEFRHRHLSTCREKYGVDSVILLPDVRRRAKEGRSKLTLEDWHKSIEKRRQTNVERFGVEDPMKLEEFKKQQREKAVSTFKEKYGVATSCHVPGFKEKNAEKKAAKAARPIVQELKCIKKRYKIWVGGKGWYQKDDQFLETLKQDAIARLKADGIDYEHKQGNDNG